MLGALAVMAGGDVAHQLQGGLGGGGRRGGLGAEVRLEEIAKTRLEAIDVSEGF